MISLDPTKCNRVVRVVLYFRDGRVLENIWNKEAVFSKYKSEIDRVVVEEIPKDGFVNKLAQFKSIDVEEIYTAQTFHAAMGRNVYVGKTVRLSSGEQISYFINGEIKSNKSGVEK